MAEVILIQPRIGDWDDLRTSPALPLALLHISNYLVKDFDVCLIDQRLTPDWKSSLKKAIGPETLAVCFTAQAGSVILTNLKIAKEVRKLTRVPIVWGGVHSTVESESTLEDQLIDIIVRGEGEITLHKLILALKNHETLDGIKGVWYKQNGTIKRNPDRDLLDLDTLPDLPYQLIDVRKYLPLYRGRKSINLQTSRGCNHICNFCYNGPFNRDSYRVFSAGRVLKHVRYVVKNFGVEDVLFIDDNFFVDRKRDMEIVKGMKEIGVTWQLYGLDILSLKALDDETLEEIEDSGLCRISVGIESGSKRIRDLIKKAGTIDDVKQVIEKMAKYKISIFASFMTGFPSETKSECKETIDLIFYLLKSNPRLSTSPMMNYGVISETKLKDLAIKNDYKVPKTLQQWGHLSTELSSLPNIVDSKFRNNLFFVTNFLDRKAYEYELPKLICIMTDLYRPIAHWRIRNLNFRFLIEKRIAGWLTILLVKIKTFSKSSNQL